MSFQVSTWKRYLGACASLGYNPEPTSESRLLQRYRTLYVQYCSDNGFEVNPSDNLDKEVNLNEFSKALYLDVSEELGYESVIKLRRTISKLKDKVNGLFTIKASKPEFIFSLGSRGEGLRMSASDEDIMFVKRDALVVNDVEQAESAIKANPNMPVMLMKTEHAKPGYVRLKLETSTYENKLIFNSRYVFDGNTYISSARFRNFGFNKLERYAYEHGPVTTTKHGRLERDIAVCLPCTTLPKAVNVWRDRCKQYDWPSGDLVEECVSLGCQLAPIGSKGSLYEKLEWRISFVLMEQKLLLAMNHCQFLCYCILKIYLNDILSKVEDVKECISSYIMKTIVLWEIQQNREHMWMPETLLQAVRCCLERLSSYIRDKNCPNFFIPENNMFENKLNGYQHQNLQEYLDQLMKERLCGLYESTSIDVPYLVFQVLINARQSIEISLDESLYVTNEDIEKQTWQEISAQSTFILPRVTDLSDLKQLSCALKEFQEDDSLSELEQTVVKAWISAATVYLTAHNFKELTAPDVDEVKFAKSLKILRACDHKGSVALLYLATLLYVTKRYESCLEVIRDSNERINDGFLQVVHISVNLQLVEMGLELESNFIRNQLSVQDSFLHIYPRLYASMLSVLCHHHLKDTLGAETEFQLLQEIHTEVDYTHVLSFQEISWEIVGICGEIIGNYSQAYQSYVRALKSPRFFLTDKAPLVRILCLIYKLLHLKSEFG